MQRCFEIFYIIVKCSKCHVICERTLRINFFKITCETVSTFKRNKSKIPSNKKSPRVFHLICGAHSTGTSRSLHCNQQHNRFSFIVRVSTEEDEKGAELTCRVLNLAKASAKAKPNFAIPFFHRKPISSRYKRAPLLLRVSVF